MISSTIVIGHLMTYIGWLGRPTIPSKAGSRGTSHWYDTFVHSGVRAVGWYLGRDLYAHLGFTVTVVAAAGAGLYLYWRSRRAPARQRSVARRR